MWIRQNTQKVGKKNPKGTRNRSKYRDLLVCTSRIPQKTRLEAIKQMQKIYSVKNGKENINKIKYILKIEK